MQGEPDETQVLCLLTYDSPFHREYVFKNCNNLYDLDHIKVLLDIFRAYTSTRSYHEVLNNCDFIEDSQLKVLPSEEIISCVDGVWNLNYVERPLGTFMLTNIRAVWFAYENETNNLSVPFLCVEKVNCVPTEYGEAFVVEVLEDNKPYEWRFMAETEDKQEFLFESLVDLLYHFKEHPFVGFKKKAICVQTLPPGTSELLQRVSKGKEANMYPAALRTFALTKFLQ
ncbi:Bardet-Biedl syndrome 5 protein homolog [Schistocerca gregaria]|uniref:Bardet-Biedl syndrome 5 protein homolog n=1 Tax=Schistocerca gregaria TaxID=7010 RepID=UPI00211E70E8|nr:Bardet-Biedl syndrome 5 protein homolog [Schistocerca gregaria]